MDASKPWHLYLLLCHDGSYYAGITNDLAARYRAHHEGRGARYTRAHPPQKLLASRPYPDRAAASRAEYALKRLPRARKLAWLLQDGQVPPTPRRRPSSAVCGDKPPPSAARTAPPARQRDAAPLAQSPTATAGRRCNDNNPSSSDNAR